MSMSSSTRRRPKGLRGNPEKGRGDKAMANLLAMTSKVIETNLFFHGDKHDGSGIEGRNVFMDSL